MDELIAESGIPVQLLPMAKSLPVAKGQLRNLTTGAVLVHAAGDAQAMAMGTSASFLRQPLQRRPPLQQGSLS